MALTLSISADMELFLNKQAAMNRQDVTTYLLNLVEQDVSADLAEFSGLEDFASSVAGIQAGLDDIEAGRTISLEEVIAQGEAGREQRRIAREGKKAQ
jgi:predicted transcriptional regulator